MTFKSFHNLIDSGNCLSRKLEKKIFGKNHKMPHNIQSSIHAIVNGVIIALGFYFMVYLVYLLKSL